jgi:hypothetical protein
MIVRLWEREIEGKLDRSVLERSPEELARAKKYGGRMFDVTVDLPATRAKAVEVLELSREVVDVEASPERLGHVELARRRVAEVTL